MVSFLSLLSPFAHRSRRNMADTQQLVNILGSTLSPDPTTRRTAERELTQLQSQPSFAQVILQLAQDANTPKAYRQAAVVNFKGWIRANYGVRLSPLFSLSFLSFSLECC
jgi:exportin-2 (importin alpha re-exporter)